MSDAWSGWEQREKKTIAANGWTTYKLVLQPEDFFLFGSGFGDEDVDMTPVKEAKVDWSTGKGVLEENLVLIPATSVKGALSHRTAFHWNRLNHYYAGSAEAKVGKDNPAVLALFGFEGDNENDQVRGNVLFSDVIEKKLSDKIFNHVAIDRFTGGAIDGALFSEKTTYGKGESFEMTILVKEKAFKEGEQIQAAFEDALKDICKGLLPLGGGVNRGNGVFTGSLTKDGKEISL